MRGSDDDPHVIEAVIQWLQGKDGMQRPPLATAKFLVFCVKLHDAAEPFPPRRDAAQHLGVSVALIDAALSQRLGTGDIVERREFVPGNVKGRVSTRQLRIIEPCEELSEIVHKAEAL